MLLAASVPRPVSGCQRIQVVGAIEEASRKPWSMNRPRLSYAEPMTSAARFRLLFCWVVLLGAVPPVLSGLMLLPSRRVSTLCAESRPVVDVAAVKRLARWERVHDWGRVGATASGLLVIAYGAGWALEAQIPRRRRGFVLALLGGLLLPALIVALWTGKAIPWAALAPAVTLGNAGTAAAPPQTLEEGGGAAYCLAHPRQIEHLRIGYIVHVGAGLGVAILTLALCGRAAAWRQVREER